MPGKKQSPIQDARSITASLTRSTTTMNATVNKANEAVASLAEDGEVIGDTLDTYKNGLKTELGETKSALRRVKMAAFKEKYLIWGSLGFFTSTVAYIISKRTRLMTLIVLFLSGAYQGGHMFSQAAFGGELELELDEPELFIKPTLVEPLIPDFLDPLEGIDLDGLDMMPDIAGEVEMELKRVEREFLPLEVLRNEHGVPVPPVMAGPLSLDDTATAVMFEKMEEEEKAAEKAARKLAKKQAASADEADEVNEA
jgi:hypothetical protein